MPPREFLKRRNALWQRLRELSLSPEGDVPDDPAFEAAVRELSTLIGWDRARVLAGLGLYELGLNGLPEDQP